MDLPSQLFDTDGSKASHLLERKYKKSTSPAGLYDDSDKLGVDGTEGAIPRDPGHADVIVALVVPHGLAEHVTELALSHNSPHHICREDVRVLCILQANVLIKWRQFATQVKTKWPLGLHKSDNYLRFVQTGKRTKPKLPRGNFGLVPAQTLISHYAH